jgi:hypothetical protein
VLHLMFEIGAALDRSTADVRATESADDFKTYVRFVGKVMTDVLLEVINPVCAQYPDLKPTQLYRPGESVPPSAKTYVHRGIPPPSGGSDVR